ncbi:selenocysteine lyase [Gluconobacter potus]|uniref:Probable septum site-determining protein MinC n=1 Tax=Gluconobacter potus TaxID=2724927 RepID=A0A149QUV4_9PROT|nr:septum site-determining protein MinC [Gluconobacter potus]KXV00944.1 selenocysteine lyase [Gluconobacter potus]
MPDPVSAPSSNTPMRIRARGRSFLALVLSPEAPLPAWLEGLDYQIARSGGLFTGKPVILDLGLLSETTPGLTTLLDDIRSRGVRVIGIEGGSRHWPAVAHWDWPETLDGGRPAGEVEIPEDPAVSAAAPVSSSGTLIIEQTVRSGQSIQHMQGDVIILGSVSSGAEIVAAGSIHVYGTLRGRAIAGVGGQSQSRIFASRMLAELLALDGYYAVTEDIDPAILGQAAQATLNEDRVRVRPLTA